MFEGYKKRLEAGEELCACWLDYDDILTEEQIDALEELDNINIKKI